MTPSALLQRPKGTEILDNQTSEPDAVGAAAGMTVEAVTSQIVRNPNDDFSDRISNRIQQ